MAIMYHPEIEGKVLDKYLLVYDVIFHKPKEIAYETKNWDDEAFEITISELKRFIENAFVDTGFDERVALRNIENYKFTIKELTKLRKGKLLNAGA